MGVGWGKFQKVPRFQRGETEKCLLMALMAHVVLQLRGWNKSARLFSDNIVVGELSQPNKLVKGHYWGT